ncbi:YraN family protein [Chitinophaga sp. Cy-1792]|uniref:YraN family protein n=1 Tax=Chitinophaga sp. Cy-1792 TaxID=2608339 RepID=UPI00141F0BE4|nr:YraN family protein [Chitinophaga sp. Cy-1792]NIG56201.1 YraN family protein [Chitinophaga sp. Cy-1792]
MSNHVRLGKQGEALALAYVAKYCEVLHCNWKSGRLELDIVARRHTCIYFIEVKTRRTDLFGYPEEAVDRKKEQHIRDAATRYLEVHELHPREIRFDIIAIVKNDSGALQLFHLKDVF